MTASIKSLVIDRLLRSNDFFDTPQNERDCEAARNLENLIKRTAKTSESNSALIIGPSGSGKNYLLRRVLNIINDDVKNNLLQIHLNGFLQTDDRIALKEITRQLQLENISANKTFRSFAENLEFLLNSLKSGDRSSKSILFVLDEFDLFCYHKNQTLLYNLFDVSQSVQTPVIIIGLTCRMDIIEIMEKRVKSRFSHRQIYIFSTNTFEDFMQMAMSFLTIPANNKKQEEWNKSVAETFQSETVRNEMKEYFDFSKNARALKRLMFTVLSCIPSQVNRMSKSTIKDALHVLNVNSKSITLTGLSILEISLVIAMHVLTKKYDGEAFNLCMVYDEYSKFVRSHNTVQTYEFAVVSKAFEHLQALELVKPVSYYSGKGATNYQLMTLLIDKLQIAEALQSHSGLPTEIQEWATSALV